MLWLRYDALPHADRYRAPLVSSLERASGMAVHVRTIHGGWDGLRPSVALEGFELDDRHGRLALGLERAELTLSWWALFAGKLRFHEVDFYRPNIVLRRGTDGLIYLADKPLNANAPGEDTAFSEWLLAQPRLGVHDATLVWHDEMSRAPEVRLTGVQFTMRKHLGHHHAALTAFPPPQLAGRIELRADMSLERFAGRWKAAGEIFGEALDTDLAGLRAHLAVPESLRNGVGSLRVWTTFANDAVQDVVADLRMRDATAQLADDALPLTLATIAGRATYHAQPGGFSFATEGLRFRLPGGDEVRPGRFSLERTAPPAGAPRTEVRADGIDLKIATALIDYFPVPRDIKAQARRFAPRGRLADATLRWTGEDARATKSYAVKGRFEDLGLNAVDAWPGVSGLSGELEGTEAGGSVRLASRRASVELGRVFRAPLVFDQLDATATWKHADGALQVAIERVRFANADAEGEVAGTWRSLPESKEKSPGYVDLHGTLSRAVASRVANYLPNGLAATRDWLERSVREGTTSHVEFLLQGDLWQFPFGRGGDGHFLVHGDIHDGRLKYHPDWPSVDRVQGDFRFENRRMEIHGREAAIFASRAKDVSAVVDDLGAAQPLLRIDGDVDTTGADSVRFLRESPLVNGPGAFTKAIAIEGPGRLKLHLEYPLSGAEPVRVAGEYQFAGATATVGSRLAMRDLRGALSFTEKGVRAPLINGTLFGQPTRLAMGTQADGRVVTTVDGRIDAPAAAQYLPATLAGRLTGATDWKARIVSGGAGTDVTVTTDLKGIGVALPEPLAKAAPDARPATLTILRLGEDDQLARVALAGGVRGRFARTQANGAARWRAALDFGDAPAEPPLRDGVWLYGTLGTLDVDLWQAVFAPPTGAVPERVDESAELRGLDLTLAKVRYLGREFAQVHARLERTGGEWSGRLDSPKLAGDVRWNPEGHGRLVAHLARLALAESAHSESAAPATAASSNLPALDVTAERFEFRGRWLGQLDLKAEPDGDNWRIDRLDIANPHTQFHATGEWRRTGTGSLSTLALKLKSDNLNTLLGQFGYGDYLKRGEGSLEGNLAWPGYPYDFALASLAGHLKVDARRGQFAKIEAGAGKLLGLLSLQSLPRRALLDFRDVFSEGFAFERIEGDVKVARGVLLADNFEIAGPAAFVSISGEVSLPLETQALTLRVVPEVSEGVALAATLIGTPVLGLSTLLVSKLLKNPLGKVVAYEYRVTGSWDNPQVTRTSAPPAPPQAAVANP